MKTKEELMQLAMQESDAEQKRTKQLYAQLKTKYEQDVKDFVDAKVKQLIADAEEAVIKYYQGKISATLSEPQRTRLVYFNEGIIFQKKHYQYRNSDIVHIRFQKANEWNKLYNIKHDDDNDQIYEFYILDSDEHKKINKWKYGQYVKDEFKNLVSAVCDNSSVRVWLMDHPYSIYKDVYWSIDLGYLDDVKK